MRLFAFKLSDGLYYRTGHNVGQSLHLADLHETHDYVNISKKSMFIKDYIDPNFQLVEIEMKEK